MSSVDDYIVRMKDITKSFPGVRALKEVDFYCQRGHVHGLVGENGAGKSTLVKILAGAYQPDEGEIFMQGKKIILPDPHTANRLGISIIYQEPSLIPYLSVAQNIVLGYEPRGRFGLIDSGKVRQIASNQLSKLRVSLDLDAWVNTLPLAQRQIVAIAKALHLNTQVIIMDEPTAALSTEEIEVLFNVIRSLKAQGRSVIYISHHLEEIFKICDMATVLKDGELVKVKEVEETDIGEVTRLMVGRELEEKFPAREGTLQKEKPVLMLEGMSRAGKFQDVSLVLHGGEILEISGLQGQGQKDLIRSIFGINSTDKGIVYLDGQRVRIHSPREAIKAGIVFVSDDRKEEGLILPMSVFKNIALPTLRIRQKMGFVREREERDLSGKLVSELRIHTPSIDQEVQYLSGGNQQKVVLAKWVLGRARVIMFCEPTRGIDVGAKIEIYTIMRELSKRGMGILMVSSELPEVLGMSDRILVICNGKIVKEFLAEEASEEKIMLAATGQAC